jgi:hypothetical protein
MASELPIIDCKIELSGRTAAVGKAIVEGTSGLSEQKNSVADLAESLP